MLLLKLNYRLYLFVIKGCVLGNDIIDMILNPQILEITLRNIWSSGAYDESVADKTLSKK